MTPQPIAANNKTPTQRKGNDITKGTMAGNNNQGPGSGGVYITNLDGEPPFAVIYQFDNITENRRFFQEANEIKARIARLNEALHAGQINQGQYCELLHVWLQRCEQFRVEWTGGRVPPDIRVAILRVQDNLGVTRTEYPAMPERHPVP